MLTSFLPKGRISPQAFSNTAPTRTAHQQAPVFAGHTVPADQFIRRAPSQPRFAGQYVSSLLGIHHGNDIVDNHGNTLLHAIALAKKGQENPDYARQIAHGSGVDFTITNKQGLTAYTACAASDQLEIAKIFRDAGAKIQTDLFTTGGYHMRPSAIARRCDASQSTINFFLNEEKKVKDWP